MTKSNISFCSVARTSGIETAKALFGIALEHGEGREYTRQVIGNLPLDFAQLWEGGARIISEETDFMIEKKCSHCEHLVIAGKTPVYRTIKYVYRHKKGLLVTDKVKIQIATRFKYSCGLPYYSRAVFATPIEQHHSKNTDRALILSRQLKCSIEEAVKIASIIDKLELSFDQSKTFVAQAKSDVKGFIKYYEYLINELDKVTATETSINDAMLVSYNDENPFGFSSDTDEEELQQVDDLPEATTENAFYYYRFTAEIDRKPDVKHYVQDSLKSLYKQAKSEGTIENKTAYYHRKAQLQQNIPCQELDKAVKFLRTANKVIFAKAKRKLIDQTYNNTPRPIWMSDDRLDVLWKVLKEVEASKK